MNLRSTKANAALAAFHSACQFFYPARLETDVFPSFIKCLLHLVRDVDDLRRGDDVVPAMDKSVEDLIEPEAVFCLSIFVEITNFAPVQYLTLASERRNGTQIRMHRGVHKARVIVVTLNVSRPIKPIHT